MELALKIKFVAGGPDYELPPLSSTVTVSDVKAELAAAGKGEASKQRLIYKGKVLKDDDTLESYGVKTGETLILQVLKGSPASPAAAPVATPTPTPTAAAASVAPTPAAATANDDEDMYGDGPASAAIAGPAEMLAAMNALVAGSDAATARLGLETLVKVIDNIVGNPTEEKYRKIKASNPVFSRKLGSLPGGRACILAAGFTDNGEGIYTLEASAAAWEHLNACRTAVAAQLQRLPTPVAAAAPPAPAAAAAPPFNPSAFGGMPFGDPSMGGGMGGLGGLPGMDPASMMQQLAANPQMMQQMLNNPMIQQMASSNPQMASQLQMLAQNPQLIQQAMSNPMMQRMMRDPQAMQMAMQMSQGNGGGMGGMMGGMDPNMMAQLMGGGGGVSPPGGGGFGGGMAPPPPSSFGGSAPPSSSFAPPPQPRPTPPAPAPNPTAPPSSTPSSGEAKTEDELIAEAIARSMEEK